MRSVTLFEKKKRLEDTKEREDYGIAVILELFSSICVNKRVTSHYCYALFLCDKQILMVIDHLSVFY